MSPRLVFGLSFATGLSLAGLALAAGARKKTIR